jgi:penicillin-binding protein A
VNRSIARLFVVVILLFAILITWTSRWTVFSATSLQNNSLNKLQFYASLKIERGRILADNGEVLAKSVKAGGGTWKREYPQGSLFAQPIGYDIASAGSAAGLEKFRSPFLEGKQTGLSSVFGPLSTPSSGDDVYTNLNPTAQAQARTLLDSAISQDGATTGSVVALVPQTGAVKVMYSDPTNNSNHPFSCTEPDCQVNLATQAALPPGSTFKIVTTTAALNSGRYTPNSIINGNSPITISGVPLNNDGDTSWGPVTLTTALTQSIDTVYAQLGEALGKPLMEQYMKRFGFYSKPPLDYPSGEMRASGEFDESTGKFLPVTSDLVDVGRMAMGQDKLTVTPLQMAMVTSAVADDGKLMEPRLTSKIVNPDGQVVQQIKPTLYDQVMKPAVAKELTQMMTDVVEEGTGTQANLEGVKVAGKTGTAQIGSGTLGTSSAAPLDDAWFVGFAPVQDPKIAVAVTLENIPNGYGGTYAAPIAAQIIKTLLAEGQ